MTGGLLGPEELNAFRARGYLVVRGLAPEPLRERLLQVSREHLAAGIGPAEYEADLHYPGAPASREAEGGRTIRRLLQAYARHPVFREWATSPLIAGPLRQLIGPAVALAQAHHNCVMTKQPRFSSVTGWHQDIRYWSFERPELVSVWLALGREFPDNGCLSFLPGTHLMQFGPERLDQALFLRQDLPENQALIATRVTPLLDPGDVVFFHCRTFHAAGANRTGEVKFSPVFTYHTPDNRPLPGSRSAGVPSVAI